jgi:hypothetical protein
MLWGVSHLAVKPKPLAASVLVLSLALCLLAPRWSVRVDTLQVFGRRGAALVAVAAFGLFWLLRERLHFFGDGYLLIRQDGLSESVHRAPMLVQSVAFVVRRLRSVGMGAEQALALLSALAGAVSVYVILRLCVHAVQERSARVFLALCLLTAGSMTLFFGHVEYYSVFAAPFLAYLLLVVRSHAQPSLCWLSWPAFLVLVSMHLCST